MPWFYWVFYFLQHVLGNFLQLKLANVLGALPTNAANPRPRLTTAIAPD